MIPDAIRAAGTKVTENIVGNADTGQSVIIEDGVSKLPDRTAFARSIATADRLVIDGKHGGCSLKRRHYK